MGTTELHKPHLSLETVILLVKIFSRYTDMGYFACLFMMEKHVPCGNLKNIKILLLVIVANII